MPWAVLAVAAGGAVGASLRRAVVRWAVHLLGSSFPYGTLAVNVVGSIVMGIAAVAMMERFPGSWGRFSPFLMTGVLGGFTTFSAFSLDALYLIERGLIERGRNMAAAAYVGGSVLVSIAGLWIGLALARAVWGQ